PTAPPARRRGRPFLTTISVSSDTPCPLSLNGCAGPGRAPAPPARAARVPGRASESTVNVGNPARPDSRARPAEAAPPSETGQSVAAGAKYGVGEGPRRSRPPGRRLFVQVPHVD